MALCYKKLWHQLIDHDRTRSDLREAIGLSPTTLAKMSKGEAVATPILEKICSTLNCDIGDIVSYVPEPPTSPKGKAAQPSAAKGPK